MNREKKLEELERRQREIADEIKQLREDREPAVGDVYRNHVQTYEMYTEHGWVYMNPKEYGAGSSGDCGQFHAWTYLGKFDDVFITKKRVAEIINEHVQCQGYAKWSDRLTHGFMSDLAAEGITQDLV